MAIRAMGVSSPLLAEIRQHDPVELLRLLEHCEMAGVRHDLKLGVRNQLRHQLGLVEIDQLFLRAIQDQKTAP